MSVFHKTTDLKLWNPEDPEYWERTGRYIAQRNLWISIPALLLAFAIWFIWSMVVVKLNDVGFHFSTSQLFTLAAMPGLVGATLRIFYSFTVPIFGGRNWTVISTIVLLLPAIGMGFAVQNPQTHYSTFIILGALCGLGGGAFSSSMANISFFFPRHKQGTALGLNAGLGNLGVSVAQFAVPLVITFGIFGAIGGHSQKVLGHTHELWLQNAGYIWVIPIILVTLCAAFGMTNLPTAKTPLKDQLIIFKRKHMYLTTILYIMSFGSYIGCCAAFPLLSRVEFPHINALPFVFLGPMVGALVRPVGGWISDKCNNGAMITFISVVALIASMLSILFYISPGHRDFTGFFIAFMVVFAATGVANGSVFRMIGMLFPPKEKAPILGFSSAMAAYGAFVLPKSFGYAINTTGTPAAAFYGFIIFYIVVLFILWRWYLRKKADIKC